MKLSVSNLDLVTDAGYPVGPRFIMGGRPPAIGFGPYKTIEEAEEIEVPLLIVLRVGHNEARPFGDTGVHRALLGGFARHADIIPTR